MLLRQTSEEFCDYTDPVTSALLVCYCAFFRPPATVSEKPLHN